MHLSKTLLSLLFMISTAGAFAAPALAARLNSLDPQSIPQHLAFYELYPDTPEGQKALQRAWLLLSGQSAVNSTIPSQIPLSENKVLAMVDYFAAQRQDPGSILSDADLNIVDEISQRLLNRQLKGYLIWSEKELLALPPEDIDVARGLLITLYGEEADSQSKIRSYEAILDMMALQILTRTSLDAPPENKIRAINRFLFEETHLRFPPHSLYAKDIDLYTFLPSVLDSRRGVCLGVSSLYICLAQRLGLQLEIVTPPGHIYVRYRDEHRTINIETTARGIDIPSQRYLSVHTRSLQKRNQKEVIGMAFLNQASVFWQKEEPEKAVAAYEKAQLYLPNDPLVKEFLGYAYIMARQENRGKSLLKKVYNVLPDHAVAKDTLAHDYLNGKVDREGIKIVFMHVDETRDSILAKQSKILEVLKRYPKFRTGWFHLAITWLQLGREKEAQSALERYHELDRGDPVVEYYLSAIAWERRDFNKAWEHLHQAEMLLAARDYFPEALKELRRTLRTQAPE